MLEVVSPTNLSVALDASECWVSLSAALRLTFNTHGLFDEAGIGFQVSRPEVRTRTRD